MGDKSGKDKGGREARKKAQHTPKEKKALKREKEEQKHTSPVVTALHARDPHRK